VLLPLALITPLRAAPLAQASKARAALSYSKGVGTTFV
jgi:hypothetical protein